MGAAGKVLVGKACALATARSRHGIATVLPQRSRTTQFLHEGLAVLILLLLFAHGHSLAGCGLHFTPALIELHALFRCVMSGLPYATA